MFHVLVVEDDQTLSQLIGKILEKNHYLISIAKDGKEALQILDKEYIDLIISDIMMPNIDGFELIKMLRDANFNMPFMIITSKDSFNDKKAGFSLGADDYMVKPIDLNEMVLRVSALLRRSQINNEHRLSLGDIVLEYDSLSVRMEGKMQVLPQKEFYLLYKLISYPNKIFTRQQIMDEIWGLDTQSDERTVDVHINRLRERFKKSAAFEIKTIRGLGYKAVIGN